MSKVINKAIDFLGTLKEESFCKELQTNDNGQHCVFGHLFVNPASPFYKVGETVPKEGSQFSYPIWKIDDKYKGDSLKLFKAIIEDNDGTIVEVNNNAPDGKIKETCIAWLEGIK